MICLEGQIQKTLSLPHNQITEKPLHRIEIQTTPELFKPCIALAQAFLTFPNKKRKIDTRTQTLV